MDADSRVYRVLVLVLVESLFVGCLISVWVGVVGSGEVIPQITTPTLT